METLFRLLLVRPAEAKEPEVDAIVVQPSAIVVDTVRRALLGDRTAERLRAVAAEIVAGRTVPSATDRARTAAAVQVATAGASGVTVRTPDEARATIESAFGVTAVELATDPAFQVQAAAAVDQLVGIKYGGRRDPRTAELEAVVRLTTYVRRLTTDPEQDPVDWMRRVIVPDGLQVGDVRQSAHPEERPPRGQTAPDRTEEVRRERADLETRRAALESAIRELTALPTDRLVRAATPDPDQQQEVQHLQARESGRAAMTVGALSTPSSRVPLAVDLERHLSEPAREAVRAQVPEAARTDLVALQRSLEDGVRDLGGRVAELDRLVTEQTVALPVGGAIFGSTRTLASERRGSERDGQPGVPSSHGSVRSVGIGDLLVVKQNLKGYEARELSHIDNVLVGEHKSTSTKRVLTTEETVVDERETTTEDERDLQSTERFEMQHESSTVQKEDQSLKLGASLSGSYGPMVEFKLTTDLGMSSSKEESQKAAETYGKDVTSRASTKVTERVKRQVTTRTLESFEEENVHEWDNTDRDEHVVGQYQWVEKRYEAQVYNYGSRVLFDLVVPEPAAFIQHTLQTLPDAGDEIVMPPAFTLSSSDVNSGNYAVYAHRYGAEGIDAPPEPVTTVTKVFEGIDDNADRGNIIKTAEIPIAEGYEAVYARVSLSSTIWEPSHQIVFTVGTRVWQHGGAGSAWKDTPLDKQQRSISATLLTFRINTVAASLEITCNRTAAALERWQIRTHAAIQSAYAKQLKAYEDKLEVARAQAVAQTHDRNPALNTSLQRDELKRAVISVFTAQHFDAFGSVETGGMGYPQIDLAEAAVEGPYIRFFEQALEWEQMMYLYYPYYWGRKSRWVELSLLEDVDADFAAFMKAGAARVVVSVRPGFELTVQHFLETGQIWDGGDPPPIVSKTYLNIVDEIKERQHAPGDEVATGDPWEVRVPTTLVLLRKKDSLPRWEKDPSGEWVDAT